MTNIDEMLNVLINSYKHIGLMRQTSRNKAILALTQPFKRICEKNIDGDAMGHRPNVKTWFENSSRFFPLSGMSSQSEKMTSYLADRVFDEG